MGPTERAAVHPPLNALPDGWSWLPLKRIITEPLKYGAALTGNDDPSSGPRYIRITDIDTATRLHSENARYLPDEEAQNFLLKPGDLLFARSGATVGKTYLFIGDEPSCFAGYLIKAKPRSLELGIWLSFFSQSSTYWEWIAITLNKATLENVSASKYKELLVPLPPVEDLHLLLGYLKAKTAEIDGLVAKLERERKLLERYRRELIARTVTRGLNPDAPMRDSGIEWIGDVPVTWKQMSLKSLLRRVSIKNQPDRRVLSVERAKGVVDRETEGSPDNHNRLPDDLGKYLAVDAGQFVMNKMKAWRGSYGVSQLDGIVSPAYFTFDLDFPDTAFFNWAIRSDAYIPFFARDSYGVRTDQWDFKIAALRSIPFFIPAIHEQQAIVAFLVEKTQSIDSILVNIDGQLELLGKYRKQVINDVVTGKIRVGGAQ